VSQRAKGDLREAIIQTSLEIGGELGAEGLTMRGIAARLGVSATALYQHFESKASILAEIRYYGLRSMVEALEPATTIEDPVERLVDMGFRYVQFARENRWLYDVLMEHDTHEWTELAQAEADRMLAPLQVVRESLREGVSKGRLRQGLDVDNASFQLWAGMHGVSSLMLGGRISEQHPAFPVADEDGFLKGFVAAIVQSFTA